MKCYYSTQPTFSDTACGLFIHTFKPLACTNCLYIFWPSSCQGNSHGGGWKKRGCSCSVLRPRKQNLWFILLLFTLWSVHIVRIGGYTLQIILCVCVQVWFGYKEIRGQSIPLSVSTPICGWYTADRLVHLKSLRGSDELWPSQTPPVSPLPCWDSLFTPSSLQRCKWDYPVIVKRTKWLFNLQQSHLLFRIAHSLICIFTALKCDRYAAML